MTSMPWKKLGRLFSRLPIGVGWSDIASWIQLRFRVSVEKATGARGVCQRATPVGEGPHVHWPCVTSGPLLRRCPPGRSPTRLKVPVLTMSLWDCACPLPTTWSPRRQLRLGWVLLCCSLMAPFRLRTSSLQFCCEEELLFVPLTHLLSYLRQHELPAVAFIPLLHLFYIDELHYSMIRTLFGCSESRLRPSGAPSRCLLLEWARFLQSLPTSCCRLVTRGPPRPACLALALPRHDKPGCGITGVPVSSPSIHVT